VKNGLMNGASRHLNLDVCGSSCRNEIDLKMEEGLTFVLTLTEKTLTLTPPNPFLFRHRKTQIKLELKGVSRPRDKNK